MGPLTSWQPLLEAGLQERLHILNGMYGSVLRITPSLHVCTRLQSLWDPILMQYGSNGMFA